MGEYFMFEYTRKIARECGIKQAFKFIFRVLMLEKAGIIDQKIYKVKPKNNIIYIDDNLTAIKTYINLYNLGLNVKIPIYLPIYDSGLSEDLLIYHGIREPVHVKVLYNIIKDNKIQKIVDIGSNIGYFPLIELYAGAKCITAIEPVPITFKYLKFNLNNYSHCKLINAAVDICESNKTIYVPLNHDGQPMLNLASFNKDSLLNDNRCKKITEYKIKTLSFSDILDEYKPELIRMDIEGYEWTLFSSTNLPECVCLIDFEVHPGNLAKVKKSLKNLKKNGFHKAIVVVNPSVLTTPLYILSKILGIERSVNLINKLIIVENIKMCKYNYLFKKSINYTTIDKLMNKSSNFLSYTGEVQVVFERKF